MKQVFKGVWIPKSIWLDEKLTPTEKCLLAEIESLDDGSGCFASNGFLAKRLFLAPTSLANMLVKLRKEGRIESVVHERKRLLKVVLNNDDFGSHKSESLKSDGSHICDEVDHIKVIDPHSAISIENKSRIPPKAPHLGGDEDSCCDPGENQCDLSAVFASMADDDAAAEMESQNPPALPKKPERKRDAILDALVTLNGEDVTQVTQSCFARAAKAKKEITAVCPNVTVDEIKRRRLAYIQRFPGAALTSTALSKHWATLSQAVKKPAVNTGIPNISTYKPDNHG